MAIRLLNIKYTSQETTGRTSKAQYMFKPISKQFSLGMAPGKVVVDWVECAWLKLHDHVRIDCLLVPNDRRNNKLSHLLDVGLILRLT